MDKLLPFKIINFALLFHVLSTEQQTRVIWALSPREAAHDAIRFSKNLEMKRCTTWYSRQKHQYKNFNVLGSQSEEIFLLWDRLWY